MSIEMDNLQAADGQNLSNNESYKLNENQSQKSENVIESKDYDSFNFEVLIDEAKNLLNKYPVHSIKNNIEQIKDTFRNKLEQDEAAKKEEFIATGGNVLDFKYENAFRAKFNLVYNDYKNQLTIYLKENEKQEKQNLEERLAIIEELKALYTEQNISNTQMFNSFRDLKTRWHNAGRIPAAKAENVFKNYFFHLDNFYKYLDLNKELQELDYQHNLEVRYSIIKRAEELVEEENVQKALNELQYLHRLWKEEAVPVIEEKREETWAKFKALTNKIHGKKSLLNEKIKAEQINNLKKKQEIITSIQEIVDNAENISHNEWQKAITKVDNLRNEFLAIGRVPKDKNGTTWDQFKTVTRQFNHIKNDFYKSLKNVQQTNLEKKLALLEIAKQHKESKDWNNSVRVIKKIQDDWRNIGHVPRKYSDKIWKEFKETCNYFFDQYKNRGNDANERFEENYADKVEFLKNFRELEFPENKNECLNILNYLNNKWNEIGKVPADRIDINKEFTKLYDERLKALNLSDHEIQDFKLKTFIELIIAKKDRRTLDEEIRKTRKSIEELEKEIIQLDNNISYFGDSGTDNPLLKDVYRQIEVKRAKLTEAEIRLRALFNVEF